MNQAQEKMMSKIEKIHAYEVFDSRGNPTIKASVLLQSGAIGQAIVPSGASTGKKEALELRDNDAKRFNKKGVLKAVNNVNTAIAEELCGECAFNQANIDNLMLKLDGTKNYSKLGANAVLGVSMAVARAAANELQIPLYKYLGGANARILPVPMLNIINGGAHANNNLDFQEFMIMPFGFIKFSDALRAVAEIYAKLKEILSASGHSTAVGDEGGFAPNFNDNEETLQTIMRAIKDAGYKAGKEIKIALDVAASELVSNKGYKIANKEYSSKQMVAMYKSLCEKYPIFSIEDGLSEDDWEGWALLSKELGAKIQLVGDDLFVTNEQILKKGIDKNIANAILIKPNQIGTLSQTMQTVRLAQRNNYSCIMSHRSGESEDAFIADFAVALNTGQIKTGSTARSDRMAKYNRLLEIEMLENAEYLGLEF